jgi:hypothetical protein
VANAVNQQQAIEGLVSNAATQSIAIGTLDANLGTLFLGNVSTNANLGAYQSYGNLTFQTITNFNVLDANLGTVVGTTIPALDANLGTVVGTTIPALDANLGTVVGTTIPALDANLGTLFLGNVSTNANLGEFQTYANSTFSTVANASSQQTTIDGFDANIGTIVGITIPALDANLGTVVGTTIPALDANVGLQSINPVFTGQSLSITNGNVRAFGGNTTVYASGAPSSSIGSAGDVAGRVFADSSYIYICYGNYDGSINIWTRTPNTTTSWP